MCGEKKGKRIFYSVNIMIYTIEYKLGWVHADKCSEWLQVNPILRSRFIDARNTYNIHRDFLRGIGQDV